MTAKNSAINMVTGAVILPERNLAMLFIDTPRLCAISNLQNKPIFEKVHSRYLES
jgi:hypothetical protein